VRVYLFLLTRFFSLPTGQASETAKNDYTNNSARRH
jgi:hypothetical protein